LPQHNLELQNKCGIYTLEKAGKLNILDGCHWGKEPNKPSVLIHTSPEDTIKILVWHIMCYTGILPWVDCPAPSAGKLLRKYHQYDLILTGHNHKPFWTKEQNRLLVNPGSLMRQNADQIDYRPAVWLWFSFTNTVKPVYLPINEKSVSKRHLESKKDRDDRIDSFVSKLNSDFESELSFEDNLERLISENKLKDSVKQIIYQSIG
jgi:DNA repair exonuclease SbcCD nuclease subunit